ncbi:MAG: hypothetical protein H6541_02595 [Lentimicrobiaceae bacterium]|nr:hypothetical protein [Lentimicrobiaceae bacterium]MCO5265984.1 hypothetical protein [Lentimicrobium sp.]
MKKTIILIFFIALSNISYAQQPIDSLYLWVNFQEESITIDIPDSYFNHRTTIPRMPTFVVLRKLNIMVPSLPAKDTLLQIFENYLTKNTTNADNAQRLDGLRVMVLYLYFSQNDLSQLQPEVLVTLGDWQAAPETLLIRKEIGLVRKWVEMAK